MGCGLEGSAAHGFAGSRVDHSAGCFFHEFLMAPLDRALTLEQMHPVSLLVKEHLDLDMARLIQVALKIETIVPKGREGLPGCGPESGCQFPLLAHDPDPLAAPARGSLDCHGKADFRHSAQGFGGVRNGIGHAGHTSDSGSSHGPAALDLVPHHGNSLRRWADPGQPRGDHGPGKVRVFGQEPIARVNRLGAADPRSLQDCFGAEVSLRWSGSR